MAEKKPRKKAKAKYVLRWWEGSQRRQASFDRAEDRDKFRDALRRIQQARGVIDVGSDVTLAEFMEDYWRLHAVPNLEEQTRSAYRQQWGKWIEPRLGAYKLRALSAKVIHRQLVEEMRRKGAGDPTINYALAVLQSIMSLAMAEGRVPENAVKQVRKPPVSVTRAVPPIPCLTIEKLRARLGARDAMLIGILGYVGPRPQEVLALHVEDVLDGKVWIHRKNVRGKILNYTKTKRDRPAPLFAPVAEDLTAYLLATGVREGLLFPNDSGKPWTAADYSKWRRKTFKPNAIAVGLPDPIPYDLRGSSVSLQVWEGRTMLEVARNHGHSVKVCEDHYAAIFEGYDPAKRTSAATAIREARKTVAGAITLFDIGGEA